MKSGRSLIFCIICLTLIVPASATAAGLIDPFRERFIVGHYSQVEDIVTDADGWPTDLFARPTVDTVAVEYWPQLMAAYANKDVRCLGWRFGAEDSTRLLAVADSPLTRIEGLKWSILESAAAGETAQAMTDLDDLLNHLGSESPASEVFVWKLRRRALVDRLRATPPADDFWLELLTLGSFDRSGGWAIWRTYRQSRPRDLLPPDACTRQTALWLLGVRETGITPRDLDRSAFDPELKAALGGRIFEKANLRRHYGLYPQPPADSRLQDSWLAGKWRLAGYSSEQALKLAEMPGVADTHRAQYYRRAGERLVLAGAWQAGRDAFRQAWSLSGEDRTKDVRARIGVELERAATLARHVSADGWAERLEQIAPAPPVAGTEAGLEPQAVLVDKGQAPDIDGRHQPQAPAEIQDALWRESLMIWAKWGQTLFADESGRQRVYHKALRKVLHAETGQLPDAAAAAVSLSLASGDLGTDIADWMLWQDLAIISDNKVPAMTSPIPAALVFGNSRQTRDLMINHVLLGLAILYGDGRGQMAAVQSLPASGLSPDHFLKLMYPVPRSMGLAAAITRAGLEPELVLALIRNESRFDPGARSRAGALGWMQIMPFHFPGRGFSDGQPIWRHPDAALQKGLTIIRENMRRYDNDPYRVLAGYNAGPTAVNRWQEQLGGKPDRATFLSWIGYPETRSYVRKVLIDRQVYAWLFDTVTVDSESGSTR